MATVTANPGGRGDRYEPIKRLGMVQIQPPRNPNKPLTSFFINDILSGGAAERQEIRPNNNRLSITASSGPSASNTNRKRHHNAAADRFHPYFLAAHHAVHPNVPFAVAHAAAATAYGAVSPAASSTSSSPGAGCRPLPPAPLHGGPHGPSHGALSPGGSFRRPWADSPPPRSESCSSDHRDDEEDDDDDDVDEEISVDDEPKIIPKGNSVSPLDALLQMTSKTFDGLDGQNAGGDDASRRDQLSLFAKNTPPKKRRKSRTAFTNQQIYELEKRFLYQKYLTPADRDEIAAQLGLSNAQVITWFQNRRAKLKRDLEELKADVTAAKSIDGDTTPPIFDSEDEYQAYKNQKQRNSCTSETSNQGGHQGASSPKSATSGSSSNSSDAPHSNLSLSVSINTAANMAAANMTSKRKVSHDPHESRDSISESQQDNRESREHESNRPSVGPASPEVSVTSPASSAAPSSPRSSSPPNTS